MEVLQFEVFPLFIIAIKIVLKLKKQTISFKYVILVVTEVFVILIGVIKQHGDTLFSKIPYKGKCRYK